MRTCSVCQSLSPDTASRCVRCSADLSLLSTTSVALAELKASPRVERVRLVVADDACPACEAASGEFVKEQVPALPTHGCSHPNGCRCFYVPALTDIYP